ncbi:MAG: leucine/isoleucine/valine transporter permease subunit [Anaerolinea sp.]|nr:leucine/isoleucine/valine transporter permease subunit [Anaerolinea sp.]
MTATSVGAPMTASQSSRWSPLLKIGLLGGVVALYMALVGIMTALASRMVITGLISLGQIILLSIFIMFGYMAAQRAAAKQARPPVAWCLVSGAIAGLIISLFLSALVVIAPIINLRSIFINASPELFKLLTFGQGVPTGLYLLIGVGVVVGLLSAGLFLLPDRLRRAVGMGLVAIPIVSILNSSLFAGRGISPAQAALVFGVGLVITYFWQPARAATNRRFSAMPTQQQRVLATVVYIILGIGVLLLPLLGPYPAEILDTVGLYILMGLGLNIVVGFAGLLDLGYVAFFALGAYTVGILTSPEIQWIGVQLTWWQALPFAVIVGTLAGVILGIPVLQMRGDYLAIVTLGFGEIIRLIFLSDWLKPLVGGSNGITRIPRAIPAPAGSGLSDQQMLFYIIVAGILVAAFIATRLKYSRLGRNWAAMREDEDVAQAMGINLVRTKLMAFATGAGLSALSGAIFASKLTSVYPHSFNLLVSINILAVIIVGGLGSIPGVIVGALVLVGLPELLREFAEYRLLVYGAVLVFMMLKRPEGLLPEARRKLELHAADEA